MIVATAGWVTCGALVVIAAVRCRDHPGALVLGRWAVGALFIPAGAVVNAIFLWRGEDYAGFADGAYVAFVRHAWNGIVVPHHAGWIALLIAFELGVGVLALRGGRATQLGDALAIAFHVALLSFGWGFYAWSVPMIAALVTLLRAERRATAPTEAEPALARAA